MIKRKKEIQTELTPNLKGGDGSVTVINFLTEQESKGAGRLFAISIIEPGSSIGAHTHDGDMETYYILKGKALISDNGSDVTLEPGDCHICQDGQTHSIKSIGEETLEYIAIILYSQQKTA